MKPRIDNISYSTEEFLPGKQSFKRVSFFSQHFGSAFLAINDCHNETDNLASLDYDQLINTASVSMADRLLVRPTFPGDSYLLHKILPEYEDRLWTVMPPEWAEDLPLDGAELQIIEEWIATGARP